MADPWDRPAAPAPSKRSRGGRCDPKQPLPRLEPQALADIGRHVVGAAQRMIQPAADFVDAVAAAAARDRERDDQMVREAVERHRQRNVERGYPEDGPALPSMGQRENQSPILTAQLLDHKFHVAQMNGNAAGMEAALSALAALLIEFLRARGKMQGDQDKLDQTRAEILRNSPNMAPHVRHLSRSELAELRRAPTPSGPGVRIRRLPITPPRAPRR